ncbi:MAG: HEPN domain-containing protein [Deltaproteobacteria bacterium]|nr:HEPN domain-containing protein [Deltaproteobacteria bacterium]
MTSDRLVRAYLEKAALRIKTLRFMHDQKGYSDVVREAQECVELLLKALLRDIAVEIPSKRFERQRGFTNSSQSPQV